MENVLIRYDKMSDEEIELQSTQLAEVRMKRLEGKIKKFTKDLELTNISIEKTNGEIKIINDTLKVSCIDRFEMAELDDKMKKRVFHFVGKVGSNKYILFFKYYKMGIVSDVKKKFGENDIALSSIKDLKKSDFELVLNFIKSWKPTGKMTNNAITKWNERLVNETITKTQESALDWYMNKITLESEGV